MLIFLLLIFLPMYMIGMEWEPTAAITTPYPNSFTTVTLEDTQRNRDALRTSIVLIDTLNLKQDKTPFKLILPPYCQQSTFNQHVFPLMTRISTDQGEKENPLKEKIKKSLQSKKLNTLIKTTNIVDYLHIALPFSSSTDDKQKYLSDLCCKVIANQLDSLDDKTLSKFESESLPLLACNELEKRIFR